jgi:hypothetical protein
VCVVLCTVFRLIVVLFCVKCVVCVLCLIVVPLPPGEKPFSVKINNNKKVSLKEIHLSFHRYYILFIRLLHGYLVLYQKVLVSY